MSEEGLVRPRALRAVPLATRAAFESGTHYGSTGRSAEAELSEPAAWAGRVRRLELPRLSSDPERGNREEGGDSPASRVERGAGGGVAWVRAGLRVVWASALRTATERLGVNRAGASVLAAAAQGQHELEEDQSEMSDIDVRSRQERESGDFYGKKVAPLCIHPACRADMRDDKRAHGRQPVRKPRRADRLSSAVSRKIENIPLAPKSTVIAEPPAAYHPRCPCAHAMRSTRRPYPRIEQRLHPIPPLRICED